MTRRAVILGGSLNNGANAGRFYVNVNNALSNANWNIAARISVSERHVSWSMTPSRKGLSRARNC